MKGKILGYDKETQAGVISGEDGKRYAFTKADWKSPNEPTVNASTDFEIQDSNAVDIYKVGSSVNLDTMDAGGKKWIAVALAFFFGALGAHKFFLGYTKQGIIMALVFLFGFILLGIPSTIIAVIAFIECFLYLIKSPEDFEKTYISNQRAWF